MDNLRDMPMIVVDRIDPPSRATVTLGHGRQIGTPMRVTFAGDPRTMEAMRVALAESAGFPDSIGAVVEPWQIAGESN